MTPVFGLDASFSAIDWDAVLGALHSRPQVYVQCLWTGGYRNHAAVRSVAEANLRGARERGLVTAGYINVSPWYPQAEGLRRAQEAAGAEWEHLRALAVDVEIEGVTLGQVRELCELAAATGKRVCIYTAQWFWAGKLGNPRDDWLRAYPLWYALYDGVAELKGRGEPGFGPAGWPVVGKQFQGTTAIAGAEFDLNVFDLEWWQGGDDMAINWDEKVPIYPLTEDQQPPLGKLLNDLFWAVIKLDERVKALEEQKGGGCQCACRQ